MGYEIRYPNITGANEREMILQLRGYLYQLVDQLNYIIDSIAKGSNQDGGGDTEKDASAAFSEIKPLIVKSTEIAKALHVLTLKFKGEEIPKNTDIDKLTEPRRYFGNKNAGYKNSPIPDTDEFVLEVSTLGDGKAIQVISSAYDAAEVYVRRRFGTRWGEWEAESPPMIAGKEYRTTERYQGKAVYTALIALGNLPNASTKLVAHGLEATGIVRCVGQTTSGINLPMRYDGGSNWASICADASYVVLTSGDDKSNISAYAQIWYTRD